jgi:hypothetical protein
VSTFHEDHAVELFPLRFVNRHQYAAGRLAVCRHEQLAVEREFSRALCAGVPARGQL